MTAAAIFMLLSLAAAPALAGLVGEEVEYGEGDTVLRGYLVYDAGIEGERPGVLVVHEWWGLNDHARKKADDLAREGYIAPGRRHVRGGQDHRPSRPGRGSGLPISARTVRSAPPASRPPAACCRNTP